MPGKKMENAENSGTDDSKLIVQKSLPLFSLWRSPLTLSEFKILDTYLAKIDSHKPKQRVVVLKKGELEQALGVTKINKSSLEERLLHLMESVVHIDDGSLKNGFCMISYLSRRLRNSPMTEHGRFTWNARKKR